MHDSIAESRPYGLTYHSNRKSSEFTMKCECAHFTTLLCTTITLQRSPCTCPHASRTSYCASSHRSVIFARFSSRHSKLCFFSTQSQQNNPRLDRKQERVPTRVIYRDASSSAIVRHSVQLNDAAFEHPWKAEVSFYRGMETDTQLCPTFMLSAVENVLEEQNE